MSLCYLYRIAGVPSPPVDVDVFSHFNTLNFETSQERNNKREDHKIKANEERLVEYDDF